MWLLTYLWLKNRCRDGQTVEEKFSSGWGAPTTDVSEQESELEFPSEDEEEESSVWEDKKGRGSSEESSAVELDFDDESSVVDRKKKEDKDTKPASKAKSKL